jgi:hypothetical protein
MSSDECRQLVARNRLAAGTAAARQDVAWDLISNVIGVALWLRRPDGYFDPAIEYWHLPWHDYHSVRECRVAPLAAPTAFCAGMPGLMIACRKFGPVM